MDLRDKIRQIPNFPKEGIVFRDITTLIKDKDAFKQAVDEIVSDLKDKKIDYIVGPEARGFLMGSAVAYALGVGFVPVRKKANFQVKSSKRNMILNMVQTSWKYTRMP